MINQDHIVDKEEALRILKKIFNRVDREITTELLSYIILDILILGNPETPDKERIDILTKNFSSYLNKIGIITEEFIKEIEDKKVI